MNCWKRKYVRKMETHGGWIWCPGGLTYSTQPPCSLLNAWMEPENQLIYLYSHSLFEINLALLVLAEGRKGVPMTYFGSGILTFLFRCASISSTYPCRSVGPSVTLSDFQSVSISGRPTWKVEEKGPQLFFSISGPGVFDPKNFFYPKNERKNKNWFP